MDSNNRNQWVAAACLLAGVLLVLNYFYEAGKLQKLLPAFLSGPQKQAEPAPAMPAPSAAAPRPVTWKEYYALNRNGWKSSSRQTMKNTASALPPGMKRRRRIL